MQAKKIGKDQDLKRCVSVCNMQTFDHNPHVLSFVLFLVCTGANRDAHESGPSTAAGDWRRTAGKMVSGALFASMWIVPPAIHRAGYR